MSHMIQYISHLAYANYINSTIKYYSSNSYTLYIANKMVKTLLHFVF